MFFYYPYFHVVLESSIILLQEYANFCLRLNKAQFFIDENELIGIGNFPVTTYLVSETQFIFIFKPFSFQKLLSELLLLGSKLFHSASGGWWTGSSQSTEKTWRLSSLKTVSVTTRYLQNHCQMQVKANQCDKMARLSFFIFPWTSIKICTKP